MLDQVRFWGFMMFRPLIMFLCYFVNKKLSSILLNGLVWMLLLFHLDKRLKVNSVGRDGKISPYRTFSPAKVISSIDMIGFSILFPLLWLENTPTSRIHISQSSNLLNMRHFDAKSNLTYTGSTPQI